MAYTTINKSTDYFNTKLYTGNATTDHAQTGVGFQPDWLWIKERGGTGSHILVDAVRGVSSSSTPFIKTNSSGAEVSSNTSDFIKSLDSDGFTLGADSYFTDVNKNSSTYASWNWKANGQGSSNTDGSINTTYTSVNTTAGFSICSYTGTGSNATIGHGLGVAPQVVLIKELNGTNNWLMSHQPLSASLGDYTRFMTLNSNSAVSGAGNVVFQNSAFTSSVFNVGTSAGSNGNGQNFIAYCFAEKTGYSKFGSYTANADSGGNGPFVYCGFKPAFVLAKNISQSQGWVMIDNKRNTSNEVTKGLQPNTNGAETDSSANNGCDFLSNGFKIRAVGTGDLNYGSGQTYIYMAFGQSLVGSNNVPCTAR